MNTPGEMIAVIEAHCEGRTVQYRELLLPEKWQDCHNNIDYFHPAFDRLLYRIKPEPPKPREWWVWNAVLRDKPPPLSRPGEYIHVREVLPDEEGKA